MPEHRDLLACNLCEADSRSEVTGWVFRVPDGDVGRAMMTEHLRGYHGISHPVVDEVR